MYRTKIDYLNEQMTMVRRQNNKLQCMLAQHSQDSNKSLMFQLKQQNEELRIKINELSDELLLQKQSRLIENNTHQQSIEQYNSIIFQMKQQIKKYQSILKEQQKVQQDLGAIQKWVRTKIGMDKNQMFHNYADPILFFNILEQFLSLKIDETTEEFPNSYQQTDKSDCYHTEQKNQLNQQKWFEQQSQIYFIRKKRKQNLRLNLQKAKLVQINYNRALFKNSKQLPLQNHKLLKQSYVNLIFQYEKLRKKVVLYEKYIQQLQNRNNLLIGSNLQYNQY